MRILTTNRAPPLLSLYVWGSTRAFDEKVETKEIQWLLKQSWEIEFTPCFTEEDTEARKR